MNKFTIVMRSGVVTEVLWPGREESLWQELEKERSEFECGRFGAGNQHIVFRLGASARDRIDLIEGDYSKENQ